MSRGRRIDRDLDAPFIPGSNELHRTQAAARAAAQAEARRRGSGWTVDHDQAHRPGQLPHYHLVHLSRGVNSQGKVVWVSRRPKGTQQAHYYYGRHLPQRTLGRNAEAELTTLVNRVHRQVAGEAMAAMTDGQRLAVEHAQRVDDALRAARQRLDLASFDIRLLAGSGQVPGQRLLSLGREARRLGAVARQADQAVLRDVHEGDALQRQEAMRARDAARRGQQQARQQFDALRSAMQAHRAAQRQTVRLEPMQADATAQARAALREPWHRRAVLGLARALAGRPGPQ